MDWLEHDEVESDGLPEWAQGGAGNETEDAKPYRLRVLSSGFVLERGSRASALRWQDVLVLIRLESPQRLLIAAPRQPPLPPWFEIEGPTAERVERMLRARLDGVGLGGYREGRRRVQPMSPEQVLTAVIEHAPLPGAVEIPKKTPDVKETAKFGAILGASLGLFGMAFGPVGVVAAIGVGALSGDTLFGGAAYLHERRRGRVLVLTPDAFVAAFDGARVRAVPWALVRGFSVGQIWAGQSALIVHGHRKETLGRVLAREFSQPLDVIVAVAEAYRKRASR